MDISAVLARAYAGLGKHTVYASPGHMPSFAATSLAANGDLDCSGLIYWCLRFGSTPPESRRVDHPLYKKVNGGWFETTAIYADGLKETGFFHRVEPVVGAFLVYPDHRGSDGKVHDGRIGIVTAIDPSKSGIARVTKVIHCSHSGWINKGDAVQETGPDIWLAAPASIAVWYEGMTPSPTLLSETLHAPLLDVLVAPGAASAALSGESDAKPKFRTLTAGGSFSDDPYDMGKPRSIRTNNPGALNVTGWQRLFPGFVGVTAPDHAGNVTSIYVTPEHGIAAWHHLMTHRYGYGEAGSFAVSDLARRYAGVASPDDPGAKAYVKGWAKWSKGLAATTVMRLDDDVAMVALARGMFGHEAGKPTPLIDAQIVQALKLKRASALPPH